MSIVFICMIVLAVILLICYLKYILEDTKESKNDSWYI